VAIATAGCNVIGRHNFLAQKLEAKILFGICALSCAPLQPLAILPQICTVWDEIFTLQQIFKESWEHVKDLYTCFVDVGKVYGQGSVSCK